MKKGTRFLAVFFTVLLLFSTMAAVTAGAAAENRMINGDFEASGTAVSPWYLGGATLGSTYFSISTDKVHGGTNSLKMANSAAESKTIYAEQKVTKIAGGTEYAFSVWANTLDSDGGVSVKFEFHNNDTITATSKVSEDVALNIPDGEDWAEYKKTVNAPANCTMIAVYLRNYGKGTVYFDDVVLFGEVYTPPPAPVITGTVKENVVNGDFESFSENIPESWAVSGDPAGESVSMGEAREGEGSLSLTGDGEKYLAAVQYMDGIVAETDYEITLWTRGEFEGEAGLRAEFHESTYMANSVVGETKTVAFTKSEAWTEHTFTVSAPAGSKRLVLELYQYGTGTVLIDDVSAVGRSTLGAQGGTGGGVVTMPGVRKEMLVNGDFELATPGAELGVLPANFAKSPKGETGTHFRLHTDSVHNGNFSYALINEESLETLFLQQYIRDPIIGDTITVSAWADTTAVPSAGSSLKIEFHKKAAVSGDSMILEEAIPFDPGKPWTEYSKDFVIPDGCLLINFYIRHYGTGTLLLDDVSILGSAKMQDSTGIQKDPVEGTGNMVANADFEEGEASTVWDFKDAENTYLTDKKVRSGKQSLMIEAKDNSLWARQHIKGIVGGAEYQATAWVNTEEMTSSSGITIRGEFWSSEEQLTKENYLDLTVRNGEPADNTLAGWQLIEFTFTAPENCVMYSLFLANYGNGTVYFDDICLYMTKAPDSVGLALETDWIFHYSEWGKGRAEATFRGTEPLTVDFQLLDGETVLEAFSETAAGKAVYHFDLSLMEEKGKEYTVKVAVRNAAGEELGAATRPVYRYDRPTVLTEDGVYVVNGKPFYPVHITTVPDRSHYAAIKALGVNVATAYLGDFDKSLEEAQANGMMLVPLLYQNMLPAGHPDNLKFTLEFVEKYKDHPALFAWSVMDEPLSNGVEEDWLITSYKAIRDIDPVHPIWLTEPGSESVIRQASKYCDIVVGDSYTAISGRADDITGHTAAAIAWSMRATLYQKPVYSMLQAFKWHNYWPTADEVRHMSYSSLFEGAQSIGFYKYALADEVNNLPQTDIGPDLAEFNNNELPYAMKHFMTGEYPMFNEYKGAEAWYRGWVQEDGNIYLVVLSQSDHADATVTIPMESFDGKIRIESFTAETYKGAEYATVTCADAKLTVSVPKLSAILYKITPAAPVDLSGLSGVKYLDLADYAWARGDIETLRASGIVNSKTPLTYGPGEAITRADFAMFLVRTLGITAEATENFADVAADAYYAKELAAGKASGILEGVGDNRFNPEATITRQDMMTMLSRALDKTGETDLSAFSDSAQIADYARAGVSAMIAAGVIRGNADGTLNPLGNTTRAEAAVIMMRIQGE